MAQITKSMRLTRALEHLEKERLRELDGIEKLENIHIPEIITIRNEKYMYLARVEQMIRNTRAKLQEAKLAEKLNAEVGA